MEQIKDIMQLDGKALIEIIERNQNMGEQDKIRVKDELAKRNLSPEKIHELALEVNSIIASEVLKDEGISTEDVGLHKSIFLNQEEVKQIYIQQMDEYMKYKDQFRFDVWSYAVGGI